MGLTHRGDLAEDEGDEEDNGSDEEGKPQGTDELLDNSDNLQLVVLEMDSLASAGGCVVPRRVLIRF